MQGENLAEEELSGCVFYSALTNPPPPPPPPPPQEAAGQDLDGLYLVEQQEALARAQQEKLTHFASIPGMLNDDMANDD